MGLTQEGRAPRNFLQLSAPPQTASKVSLERVAACLGAGDPPRGWAEAFKRLAILNGHADPPFVCRVLLQTFRGTRGVGAKGEAIGAVRPQLGAGTLAFPVWREL